MTPRSLSLSVPIAWLLLIHSPMAAAQTEDEAMIIDLSAGACLDEDYDCFVYSIDNDNERYSLTVVGPLSGSEDPDAIVVTGAPNDPPVEIHFGGEALTLSPWGHDSTHRSWTAELTPDEATEIADAIGVTRQDRRDLEPGLQMDFTGPEEITAGSPVPIVFTITNGGSEDLRVATGGAYRGSGRDNRFSFTITRDGELVPDIGSSMNLGGLGSNLDLVPGASVTQEADATAWAAFDEPGTYVIECSFEVELSVPYDASVYVEHLAHAHERWVTTATGTVEVVVE